MSYAGCYPASVAMMLASDRSGGRCAVCRRPLTDGESVVADRHDPTEGVAHVACAQRRGHRATDMWPRPYRQRVEAAA